MKKAILFLIPFLITVAVVVFYFKLTQKIANLRLPTFPSISLNDLIKLSRFSLDKAPSESLVGNIISMSGDVEYEARMATEAAKINSPVEIQQGESLVTGVDGKLILNFDKAVEVDMSSDTSIGIIQTLPADIVFSQSMGSAEYKKLASIPVSIRSKHLLIEDNGDVTVTIDKVKPIVTVVVNSGSATFAYNNTNNISRVWTVEGGKTLTFNDGTRRVVIK